MFVIILGCEDLSRSEILNAVKNRRIYVSENRNIDIKSVGLYYFMYYNRKDYSLYKLPLALIIFYRKKYIDLEECIKILDNSMEMSEKVIRTIMTDFYNLLSNGVQEGGEST